MTKTAGTTRSTITTRTRPPKWRDPLLCDLQGQENYARVCLRDGEEGTGERGTATCTCFLESTRIGVLVAWSVSSLGRSAALCSCGQDAFLRIRSDPAGTWLVRVIKLTGDDVRSLGGCASKDQLVQIIFSVHSHQRSFGPLDGYHIFPSPHEPAPYSAHPNTTALLVSKP